MILGLKYRKALLFMWDRCSHNATYIDFEWEGLPEARYAQCGTFIASAKLC